jgi:hypothetical protein
LRTAEREASDAPLQTVAALILRDLARTVTAVGIPPPCGLPVRRVEVWSGHVRGIDAGMSCSVRDEHGREVFVGEFAVTVQNSFKYSIQYAVSIACGFASWMTIPAMFCGPFDAID